jgi:hypothetical protein
MISDRMNERRSISRWPINHQARLKLDGSESFVDCLIKDINLKGVHILCAEQIKKDSFVKFCLFLAEGFSIDVEAWVAWHKTTGESNSYGFYFTRVKDADKEKIYRFMLQHCPKHFHSQCWQGTIKEGGEDMPEASFSDKRIFERFAMRLPLRFLDPRSNTEGRARTQDISAKGMGLLSDVKLQPNTPLELWLEIPDHGEPLYTRGEVVWSKMVAPNEFRTGVNLEKADLMGLSRVLRVS